MKKILVLLILTMFLVSCGGNDDDNVEKGYLVSLENVKKGIIGVWRTTVGGEYYREYSSNGIRCVGFSPNELNGGCSKYEILQQGGVYVMRSYGLGDLEGTGSYVDRTIKVLNNEEFIYIEDSVTDVRFLRMY